jgi:DNA processing protein
MWYDECIAAFIIYMSADTQLFYLHALNSLPEIGSRRLRLLLDRFGGEAEAVWNGSLAEWLASGIGTKIINKAHDAKSKANPEQFWSLLEQHTIRAIATTDPDYPQTLLEIPDPPIILYLRGTLPGWNTLPCITIVGTRKPTPYGVQATESLTRELVRAGVIVVSGLAFGVDALAHRFTLEANGITVAVLGNGLDSASIAPHTHLPLAQNIIAKHGALISEYPPLVEATPGTFPARNRIMAGLSQATLVTEAAEKSGSLITTRHALEFNRDVWAVPGSIFSHLSAGPNRLIRAGAKTITCARDLLDELRPPTDLFSSITADSTSPPPSPHLRRGGDTNTSRPLPNDLSPDETRVLAALGTDPLHIDKLAKHSTLETTHLSTALTLLEIKGLVKNVGGMNYIKT